MAVKSVTYCDVCDGIPTNLLFEVNAVIPPLKTRRRAKREVSNQLVDVLQEKLVETRDVFLDENPNFKMIGSSFVSIIGDICKNVRFIDSVDSLSSYAIHPQLRLRLFVTICQVLVDAPPPRKRSHRSV